MCISHIMLSSMLLNDMLIFSQAFAAHLWWKNIAINLWTDVEAAKVKAL